MNASNPRRPVSLQPPRRALFLKVELERPLGPHPGEGLREAERLLPRDKRRQHSGLDFRPFRLPNLHISDPRPKVPSDRDILEKPQIIRANWVHNVRSAERRRFFRKNVPKR
jgi:hypothetical protein